MGPGAVSAHCPCGFMKDHGVRLIRIRKLLSRHPALEASRAVHKGRSKARSHNASPTNQRKEKVAHFQPTPPGCTIIVLPSSSSSTAGIPGINAPGRLCRQSRGKGGS